MKFVDGSGAPLWKKNTLIIVDARVLVKFLEKGDDHLEFLHKSGVQFDMAAKEVEILRSRLSSSGPRLYLVDLLRFCKVPGGSMAELGMLSRRLKKKNVSPWFLRLRLLEAYLTLIWVFLIRVRIENIWLPSGDRQIED